MHERRPEDGVRLITMERATGLEPAKSWLGKLLRFLAHRTPKYPSDLVSFKLLLAILPNVLDEILEKRGDFQMDLLRPQDAQKPPAKATFD